MTAIRAASYEASTGENGQKAYLVGDEQVSADEAREYAQAEAGALATLGDPEAYDGYPAEIAPLWPESS